MHEGLIFDAAAAAKGLIEGIEFFLLFMVGGITMAVVAAALRTGSDWITEQLRDISSR
jgi:hypothetical protein